MSWVFMHVLKPPSLQLSRGWCSCPTGGSIDRSLAVGADFLGVIAADARVDVGLDLGVAGGTLYGHDLLGRHQGFEAVSVEIKHRCAVVDVASLARSSESTSKDVPGGFRAHLLEEHGGSTGVAVHVPAVSGSPNAIPIRGR
jgi:hypothetical protein